MLAGPGYCSLIHFRQPHSHKKDLSDVPIPVEEIKRQLAIYPGLRRKVNLISFPPPNFIKTFLIAGKCTSIAHPRGWMIAPVRLARQSTIPASSQRFAAATGCGQLQTRKNSASRHHRPAG